VTDSTSARRKRIPVLELSGFARETIDASIAELVAERDAISHLLA
jgi:hypothetical protein